MLPAGRLRERVATARFADAALVVDASAEQRAKMAERLGLTRAFGVRRRVGTATVRPPDGAPEPLAPGARVLCLAGIARPDRFINEVRAAGFDVAGTLVFRDHHRYSSGDAARIQTEARTVRARAILTTEKDVVRLEAWCPFDPPLATVPLTLEVEEADELRAFLGDRLAAERRAAG